MIVSFCERSNNDALVLAKIAQRANAFLLQQIPATLFSLPFALLQFSF